MPKINPPRGLLNDRNAPKIIEPVTGSSGIYDVRILPITALIEFTPNFYDLLLIDVNMPLMDGFQLAQNLLRRDLNVKVCLITAGEINMDAAREVHPLKSIGCFIKKPISAEQLIKRIKAELE